MRLARLIFAAALIAAPMSAAGCSLLSANDPSTVVGALPSEQTELQIIRADLIVRAANATIAEQLTRGTITADQAARAKAITDKAHAAVKLAADAAAIEDATLAERLALLDQLILDVLRQQAAAQ